MQLRPKTFLPWIQLAISLCSRRIHFFAFPCRVLCFRENRPTSRRQTGTRTSTPRKQRKRYPGTTAPDSRKVALYCGKHHFRSSFPSFAVSGLFWPLDSWCLALQPFPHVGKSRNIVSKSSHSKLNQRIPYGKTAAVSKKALHPHTGTELPCCRVLFMSLAAQTFIKKSVETATSKKIALF